MERSPRLSKDSISTSRMHWVTIGLVSLGLISLVILVFELRILIHHWQDSSWVDLFLHGFVWLCYLGVSIALVLYPVRHIKAVKLIIQIVLWPLGVAAKAGYFHPLSPESRQGATPKRKRIVDIIAPLRNSRGVGHPARGPAVRRVPDRSQGNHLRSGYTDRQLPVLGAHWLKLKPKAFWQRS